VPTTATSLFGISCTRQLDASQLLNRPADVTRSTVQKAVVVIADSPQFFGMLRERLSVVTQAWFAQREFTDVEILRRFQDSLADEHRRGLLPAAGAGAGASGDPLASPVPVTEEDRDQYLGMSLRELVREFKWQTLVLLKCCLLQPKVRLELAPGGGPWILLLDLRGIIHSSECGSPRHMMLTCLDSRCSSSGPGVNACA